MRALATAPLQTTGPRDGRAGIVPLTVLVREDNPWRKALWVRLLRALHWSLRSVLDIVF